MSLRAVVWINGYGSMWPHAWRLVNLRSMGTTRTLSGWEGKKVVIMAPHPSCPHSGALIPLCFSTLVFYLLCVVALE